MKPILREGDYLISFYDKQDNELHQQTAPNLTTAFDDADIGLADNPEYNSYRVVRCLKNSKFNKWASSK